MKNLVIGLVIGVLVGAAGMWSVRRAAPPVQAAAAGTEAHAEGKPKDNPLHLSADARNAAGIVLAHPRSQALTPELTAFGRVLDPTPYVTLVAELATAQAALSASEKELERVHKLYAAGGNASAQAVEAAEAAAARDRAAVASVQIRLLAGWGRSLAGRDLTSLRDVLSRGAALIRLDLLPGAPLAPTPRTAQVALLGDDKRYDVEVLGPAPVADAQVQGPSFFALLKGETLPAGATLRVSIPESADPTPVLTLPRSALVHHEGSAWVYVLAAGDVFHRERAVTGRPLGDAVVITSGVHAEDQIAVAGAQQLLSAELVAGAELNER